jgi:hypothetical protein
MATIRYTHGFDLLYQLAFAVGTFVLTALVCVLAEPVWESISHAGIRIGIPEWVFTTLAVVGFIAILGGSIFILLKTVLKPGLPTYLYIRCELFAPVTWSEAEKLAFLFSGDANGKWYPLRELRKIPKEYRREVLFEFADKILRERYGSRPFASTRKQTASEPPPRAKPQDDPSITHYAKCCAVLGVARNATQDQIKDAYRKKIKRYHPDLFGGASKDLRVMAEEKTKEINAAYAYLENASPA